MSLTLRQLVALRKRHAMEHERQELLVGIVASNVVNYSMHKIEKPTSPADFMPSHVGRRDASDDLVALHNSIVNQQTLTQRTTRIG